MALVNLDPDLDREVELQIASLRRTDKMLSQITYKGKMQQPDPYMKLDQTLEVSLQIYNLVASQGCPEERLSMLRDFMDLVVAEQGKPNPYYQAAPAPPLAPNAGPAGALPPGGLGPECQPRHGADWCRRGQENRQCDQYQHCGGDCEDSMGLILSGSEGAGPRILDYPWGE